MKDKKKIEILLQVITRVYTKNPGTQKLIDKSMTGSCKEVMPPEQVFCFAFFCCWFYFYGLSKHKFFVCAGKLTIVLGFVFSFDQERNHAEFLDAGILRV